MAPSLSDTPVMGEDDQERSRLSTLAQLRPPRHIAGYEQERFLGRGSFGEVWVAVDSNTGRKVAIKYYHRRGGLDWSLLSREVEKLKHLFGDRHVVQLITVGWESDPPYYVMEYMENGSLEDLLRHGPLPVDQSVDLIRAITIGLVHAHGRGILHCDLKPGNVMLDQDGQPRLADFGQSRLSHEHAPALGTLFYMAPEQADLKADPDARWDVYALGAVLYRMLTGEAPYRNPDALAVVQQPGPLAERLSRYRALLATSARPQGHRAMPAIDSELVAVIDHCLAVDPRHRYPNAQAVLSALDARAAQRSRRPLLILGGLGPLVVLIIVLTIAAIAFTRTMSSAESEVLDRARESNRFAARDQADRLGQDVQTRWTILNHEARDPELARLLAMHGAAATAALCEWLKQRHEIWGSVAPAPVWFVLDRHGIQRGATEPNPDGGFRPSTTNLGVYFGYRDYFHGNVHSFPPEHPPDASNPAPPLLTRPHRSRVYKRKNVNSPTYVVTYSVPVLDPDRGDALPIGVLVMSSEIVGLTRLRRDDGVQRERLVVLADTWPDENRRPGVVVRHPYQESFVSNPRQLPIHYVTNLEQLRERFIGSFADPVGGEFFREEGWLTATEPVRVPGVPADLQDTGWVVLVEEDRAQVVAPIRQLRRTLALFGLLAIGLVLVVVALMWGLVLVIFNAAPSSRVVRYFRRQVGLKSALGSSSSSAGIGTPSGSGASGSTRT